MHAYAQLNFLCLIWLHHDMRGSRRTKSDILLTSSSASNRVNWRQQHAVNGTMRGLITKGCCRHLTSRRDKRQQQTWFSIVCLLFKRTKQIIFFLNKTSLLFFLFFFFFFFSPSSGSHEKCHLRTFIISTHHTLRWIIFGRVSSRTRAVLRFCSST